MIRSLKNKENGVVLVTVLMIVLAMMVLTVSIISLNVSQVMTSEKEVRRIQAETLTVGEFTRMFFNQQSTSPGTLMIGTQHLDNTSFSVRSTRGGNAGANFNNTDFINIIITY